MRKIVLSVLISLFVAVNAFSFGVETSVYAGQINGTTFGYSLYNNNIVNISTGFSYNKREYEFKEQDPLLFFMPVYLRLYFDQNKKYTSEFFGGYLQTDFTIPLISAGNFKLGLNPGLQVEAGYDSLSHSDFSNFGLNANGLMAIKGNIANKFDVFAGYRGSFSISDYSDLKDYASKNYYRSSFDFGVRYNFNKNKVRVASGNSNISGNGPNVQYPRFVQSY